MPTPVLLALTAIIAFLALASVLAYAIHGLIQASTATPDTHIHVPDQQPPTVHVDLSDPGFEPDPTPGTVPDNTFTLDASSFDPTDGTIPRINVDWAPDLAVDPDEPAYVPDPTDPLAE